MRAALTCVCVVLNYILSSVCKCIIEHGKLGSQEGKKDVTPRTSQYTTSAAAVVINGDNYTTVW